MSGSIKTKEETEEHIEGPWPWSPYIEIVVRPEDGPKFARVVDINRTRIEDYINGKTKCIMSNKGVPISLATQKAIMDHLRNQQNHFNKNS